MSGSELSDRPPQLSGRSLGEALLAPTQIYVKPVLAARQTGLDIRGMAHITGGGLPENLPRCLGTGQSAQIDVRCWTTPPIFEWLAEQGNVSRLEMFNTFNMGVGFVLIVPPEQIDQTIAFFESQNLTAGAIGEVIAGSGELILNGLT